MPPDQRYIHGTSSSEQDRLRRLNALTNAPFLEFLAVRPGQRVLELGSGLGILAAEVAERVAPGLTVGLEFSNDQLVAAPASRAGLWFLQADAHALPFREGTFDLVYCRFLLEHVLDPSVVLRAARAVLKPGGIVRIQENTILVNAFDPECPTFDRVWRKFVELQHVLGGDAQIGKKLFRILTLAGFTGIKLSLAPEVHHAGEPGYRPWIENLAGNLRSAEETLVRRQYCSQEELRQAYKELEVLAENRYGTAWFYWNRAAARRTAHHQSRTHS
jgi:SAM-dependent methyltransferase